MSVTPLNPSLPVLITTKNNSFGQCVGWIDYSPEHDLLWICALDEDGSIWIVPNKEIRMRNNWSIGRRGPGFMKPKINEFNARAELAKEKA